VDIVNFLEKPTANYYQLQILLLYNLQLGSSFFWRFAKGPAHCLIRPKHFEPE